MEKTKRISKRKMAVFSAAFICCCILSAAVKAFAAGAGEIPEGYTPVYTAEDLYGINNDTGGNYILMADIDLSGTKPGGDWDTGHGWQAIGEFSGIFDGNGHRIKNMTIYDSKDDSNKDEYGVNRAGLFSEISQDGEVKNLGLTDISIQLEKDHVYGGTGGITGNLRGSISGCYVTGVINAPASSEVGGIAGKNSGDSQALRDCYTDVDVYGKNNVGGIAGFSYSNNETVYHCYALGAVKSVDGTATAPVVGGAHSGQNYYLAANGSDKGATGLTKAQAKLEKCYTGFDFGSTWVLDKHSPFPYPQLKNCMQVRTESIELVSLPDRLEYTEGETIDLSGSKPKISYEDGYSVEVPLEKSMLSYQMKSGNQAVTVSYNGKSDQFDINVRPAAETLKITAKKTKLKVGSSFTYKAAYTGKGAVAFSSSNSSVLRIDRTSGRASARKAGRAVVTVKAGSMKKTVKVTVVKN